MAWPGAREAQVSELDVALFQSTPIPLAAKFHCQPGELLALVGPSGSGKTTLLRTIAGLYRPTNGWVRCAGRVWFDTDDGYCLTPQQRRVGVVFQDYALFPHLTACQNVMIAMGHVPVQERRERAVQWLARVRLNGLEDRYPNTLSGGQCQRVAVARALARDPWVLLLDEPFSAVDQVTRRRLQRELALLRETIDIPMVLVTHDLEEATALADRLCVLQAGKTLQTGPPETLFRRPDSPQVARLLDKHNVFQGDIVECEGERHLEWGPYQLEVHADLGGFAPGERVHWYVPPSDVILHRRGRPSRGERENPVESLVTEVIVLGGMALVTLSFAHSRDTLRFEISTHAARRNGLAKGESVVVTLLAGGIHVMADTPIHEEMS